MSHYPLIDAILIFPFQHAVVRGVRLLADVRFRLA
jgi:hypothetical protein